MVAWAKWARGLLLVCATAAAAPKKPPAPPPPECSEFALCLQAVNEAFESGDFELAQRRAARTEGLARTPPQQAALLAVQGALDAQALGLTPQTRDAVKRRFAQAQRLDPTLTVIAIPAFCRTDALEALWEEARPAVVPVTQVKIVQAPALLPAPPAPARKSVLVPVLIGALGVGAAGVGVGFGLAARATHDQARAADSDAQKFARGQQANQQALIANAAYATAGALVLGAVVTFVVTR